MAKYYDVHNHLFNKNFLGKELLYRLMKELKKFMIKEDEAQKGVRGTPHGLKKITTLFRRYRKAIRIFMQNDSTAIYEALNKTYKDDFILTPLTFDLTWCFASSADRGDGSTTGAKVLQVFDSEMNSVFQSIEKKARVLSRDYNAKSSPEDDAIWQEYLAEKELLTKEASALKEEEPSRDGGKIPGASAGWEEQLRQIEELKKHPVYGDKIFPFLAVDPRRPGIVEFAKQKVGKGKLFAGIKLYCPNGYSPTDPLLFGTEGQKDGLYAWCEANGIPITAHNSDGGFATLSKSVIINGLVHIDGALYPLNKESLPFKTTITQKNAINERAIKLNHPLIWEVVLEKYPELILNLAHFGGGQQLEAALDHPEDRSRWSNRIIDLIKNNKYVYTDVSCFTEFRIIGKFFKSEVFQEIKDKVLYGSDYTLLLLFEDDFDHNVEQFMNIFGSDFDIIAGRNPKKFLKHVL
jgi:predicted TIM-barrel fold metal-dependent hydrolase